ncbi:MAG: hypothetical protein NZM38_00890 [Cytophagales bacterium]|nr:hypothetical protein [Cytophagales bacterium]MDW8383304.1 adenylate/guanylate cyclase domain-containing protein [Flammeovirgaceae bacterium]
MKVKAFFLFFLILLNLYAEEDNTKEKAFYNAINTGNKSEAARLAIELATEYSLARNANAKAVEKYQEAIRLASEIGDKLLEARAEEAYGDHFARHGKKFADEALEHYKNAYVLYKNSSKRELYANVGVKAAEIYLDIKADYTTSEKLLTEALKIAFNINDIDLIETANELLDRLYDKTDNDAGFVRFKEEVAAYFRRRGDEEAELTALMDLRNTYQYMDGTENQKAYIRTLERLAFLYEKNKDLENAANMWSFLIAEYADIGDTNNEAKYQAKLDAWEAEEKAKEEARKKEEAAKLTQTNGVHSITNSSSIVETPTETPVIPIMNSKVAEKVTIISDSVSKAKDAILRKEKELEEIRQKAERETDPRKRKELEKKAREKEQALEAERQRILELEEKIKLYEISQRYFMYGIGASVFAIIVVIAFLIKVARDRKKLAEKNRLLAQQNEIIERQKTEVERERQKSEELLLNILPKEVAEELKQKGKYEARTYGMASIIFTDFKGFTELTSKLTIEEKPGELVEELDACFKGFDAIVEKYGLEKIKTIGDAYMCANGLNEHRDFEAPKRAVLAALEMVEFIKKRKIENEAKGKPAFDVRVGINTGTVIAGVVGSKKFAYDIWGDAVNIAARMESSGEVGKVNISATTYSFIRNDEHFEVEYRGDVAAKGKGYLEMWFVKSYSNKN